MAEPDDAKTDEAYDVMCAELDHWDILGPTAEGHYAVRRFPIVQQKYAKPSAIIIPDREPVEEGVKVIRFKDKEHAMACVQWHSLQAVLRHFKIA